MSKLNRATATIIRVQGAVVGTWALALQLPNNVRVPMKPINMNRISPAVRNFDLTARIPYKTGVVSHTEKAVSSMGKGVKKLTETIGVIYVDELKLTKAQQAAIAPAEAAATPKAKKAAPQETADA